MKSYLTLARKELKAQKITSLLILLAVILSSIATTAIGRSIGILQSMRADQASGLNGDRYATFHQLSEEQADALASDPRLYDVGSIINLGNLDLGGSGLTLFLREYCGNALDAYPSIGKIKEGRLPAKAHEIALPEDALRYLGFDGGPGDPITLPLKISLKTDTEPPYEYTAEFVLTGILESSYMGYATGTVDAVAGEGTAASLLPARYYLYSTDFKTKSSDSFQSVVYDLAHKLNLPEDRIQYNWVLLDALGISYDEKEKDGTAGGFPFLMAACVLVGGLILLAAGLVIYNILKVAVTKRIREYGALRAIGGERRQLYRLVAAQLLILCGIGIPVGLLCGVLCAKGILTAAVGLLNPKLFLASSTQALNASIAENSSWTIWPLLVSAAVTLLFAALASFPAARYASHVSPAVAMDGQAIQIKRHRRKHKRVRNFEAYYARLNLKRNRGRTCITILSMVMSITVFVALQSFSSLLDASSAVQEMHLGDYAVTNETIGFPPEAVSALKDQGMVGNLSTTKLSVYQQDEKGTLPVDVDVPLQSWESFQIAGIDSARLSSYAAELSEQDLEDLRSQRACLIKNPIAFVYDGKPVESTNLQVNDRITVNGRQMRVAGIADSPVTINNAGFVNGVQVIVSDSAYDTLTGKTQYSEVYPELLEDADADSFEAWLDEWCRENPGSHWLSYRQSDAQLAESFEQIRLLCWGLILFIGLIGVLNIINTVYTNIHTRVNEIGMQRAVGMSTRSLYQTFLWEGAYYGLIASIAGAVCGYFCTIFVGAAATDTLQWTAVPVLPILEAAAVSVAACLAATALPLRGIAKMNIVESILTIE